MKLSFFPFTLLLALAVVLGACQKATAPAPTEDVLFGVVLENLHSMEQKNVDAVMKTIHPQSPNYASTGALVQMMFDLVDVKYQLSDLKILHATPEEAQVSFVQRMEKVGGPGEFRNNIVEGIHTLRPDHGKWKLYGTAQTKVTGLDGKPLADDAPAAETPTAPAPPAQEPTPAAPAAPAPGAPEPAAAPTGNPAQ